MQPNSIRTMQSCLKALEERLQKEQEEVEVEGVHSVAVGPPPAIPDLTEAERQLGKEAADQLRDLCLQNQNRFCNEPCGPLATRANLQVSRG